MPKKAKAILKDALAARELAPEERAAAAVELAERLAELCQGRSSHEAVRRYLAHLAKEAPAMFSFLADDRVDATNWAARTRHTPSSGEPQSLGRQPHCRGGRTQGTVMSVIRTPPSTVSMPSTTSPHLPVVPTQVSPSCSADSKSPHHPRRFCPQVHNGLGRARNALNKYD